ncbi:MAG: STAS domain-containing protein [Hydrogenophaga sp.]|jgi:phospholipid transport system transporter-binding protein|nr:STAS domain-containing protein [Hydrogenophaga sp.]
MTAEPMPPAEALALPAKLTMGTATAELERLLPLLKRPQGPAVTLDAGALEVFDSSAIAILLELRREVLRQGRELRVHRLPSRLRDLMALYGVGDLLPA